MTRPISAFWPRVGISSSRIFVKERKNRVALQILRNRAENVGWMKLKRIHPTYVEGKNKRVRRARADFKPAPTGKCPYFTPGGRTVPGNGRFKENVNSRRLVKKTSCPVKFTKSIKYILP
jgi:hypothetical protein